MKKLISVLLALSILFSFAACKKGGGASGGPSGAKDVSFDKAKWETYDGYGAALEYPSSWTLYSFAEEDAAVKRSVLMINGAEDIYIRVYVDMLGELHAILSPSDNPEAELFFARVKESAAVSEAFPPLPNFYDDDEAMAYIAVIEQMTAEPNNPLPEFIGSLPERESAPLEVITLDDDGSLASAKDAETRLWGYINRSGEWVIEPQFDAASRFSEGLAMVVPAGEKYCKYIDRTGSVVIEGVKEDNSSYVYGMTMPGYTEPFREGMAAVHIDNGLAQDQVYIDRNGNIVVDATYIPKAPDTSYVNEYCLDTATPFRNGLAAVARGRNTGANYFAEVFESTYIIDNTGHVVATIPEHMCVDTNGFDINMLIGVAPDTDYIGADLVGLCDANGNLVVPCEYSRLDCGENGLYRATKDGMNGFIDGAGNVVLDFEFEDATPFACGVAGVRTDGMWGCIDDSGNFTIEPGFDNLEPLDRRIGEGFYGAAASCQVAALQRGDYWAIFTADGMHITDFTFASVGNFAAASPFRSCSHDVIVYSDGELLGLLSLDGKQICAPKFESVGSFYDVG